MNPTCCRGPSLCTSALIPESWKRRFNCRALAGSLNVAIVTISVSHMRSATLCDQTSNRCRAQELGEHAVCSRPCSVHGPVIPRRLQQLLRAKGKPFVENQIYQHT